MKLLLQNHVLEDLNSETRALLDEIIKDMPKLHIKQQLSIKCLAAACFIDGRRSMGIERGEHDA